MSLKFLTGVGLGLFIGTEYDVKPLVSYTKQHLVVKLGEFNEMLEPYKKQDPTSSLSSFDGLSKAIANKWAQISTPDEKKA